MKKIALAAGIIGAALLVGIDMVKSANSNNNNDQPPVRWADYLPTQAKLQCFLSRTADYSARAYQQAVLAALAAQGDPVALKAWEDLLKTYKPSEIMCLVGGQGLDALAGYLSGMLPAIPGLSWATRAALERAFREALERVRVPSAPH